MINQNEIARWISKHEGGCLDLPIAQVKEVMKWYNIALACEVEDNGLNAVADIIKLLERYRKMAGEIGR